MRSSRVVDEIYIPVWIRSSRVWMRSIAECGWDLAELRMRSSRVDRASDCQSLSRNSPGVRSQHPPKQWNLRGRADKAVLNKVHTKNQKKSLLIFPLPKLQSADTKEDPDNVNPFLWSLPSGRVLFGMCIIKSNFHLSYRWQKWPMKNRNSLTWRTVLYSCTLECIYLVNLLRKCKKMLTGLWLKILYLRHSYKTNFHFLELFRPRLASNLVKSASKT